MLIPSIDLMGGRVVQLEQGSRLAIESADLKILNWSWDEVIARLTVWWQLGDTRASEFMDFDGAGRVLRSEAFYGK